MPIYRRVPKRGFTNARFRTEYTVINVDKLAAFENGATVDLGAIGEGSAGLMRARIEINALAKDYATLKSLMDEVRKACKNKHGTIAGVEAGAVEMGSIGPDQRDDDIGIYRQSIDFLVTYREA